jgi:outer membrane usher protein
LILGLAPPPCLADTPPDTAGASRPSAGSDGPAEVSLILALRVNGEQVEDSVLAIRRGGDFYLPLQALTEHRILVPDTATRVAGPGADYVRLGDLPSLSVRFDPRRQELDLQVADTGMERQVLDLSRVPKTSIQPSAPGAYLNYDAVMQFSGGATYFGSQLGLGTPVLSGDLSTTGILRAGNFGLGSDFISLDTAYLREFPDDLTEIKIGDSISRGSSWSNPLRFGGLQWGTNFAIQPGYVSYPTANFAGQAALPSTLDVYINDALRYRGDVNQGPFQLNQIPTVTGGGEAQVVLTDMLGRQQVVALPFYVDTSILREGVSDFSYEAGFLREGYGIVSADYGDLLLSATRRYGITNNFTIEGHAEATTNRGATGAALTSVFAPIGEFQQDLAVAQGPGGTGWLAGLGYSRQSGSWSVGFHQTWQSQAFNTGAVSFSQESMPQREQTQANIGINLDDAGSLSFTAARQRYEAEAKATIGSATWTLPITDRAFVNAYALYTRQGEGSTTVGLTLTFLFGGSYSGTVDSSIDDHRLTTNTQFRHTPAGVTGWDYGATVSTGEISREEADVTRRTTFGDFGAAIDQEQGATAGRLTATGGVALVDGGLFATRSINDAFGLVSVPGYAGVTVTQDNRPIGVTDADGDLFVPTLLSNNPNRIGLASADLPVDVDIDTLETTVTPGYHGIAKIDFRARQSPMRLVVVNGEDGKPVQPGIEVDRVVDGKKFRSGFGGEVYLEGDPGQEFKAANGKADCRFRLPPVGPTGDVPTLLCKVAG